MSLTWGLFPTTYMACICPERMTDVSGFQEALYMINPPKRRFRRIFCFIALPFISIGACSETPPEIKPDSAPAVSRNDGLNIETRIHYNNDLGRKKIAGLNAMSVKWRFLSHVGRYPGPVKVTGICQTTWQNETTKPIDGYYLIVFLDENGFRVGHVENVYELQISGQTQRSTEDRFTVMFDNVGAANLIQKVRVLFTPEKIL